MEFSVRILGSNSAFPTSTRFPTAHVLNVREQFYLIDCGEGTQIQLRKNHIKFGRINQIFISHLHGDHFFGLFGLLSTFNLYGRTKELRIFSPPGLKSIVSTVFNSLNDQFPYPINFIEIDKNFTGSIYQDKGIEVFTFPLKHRIQTQGYLFREPKQLLNIRKDCIEKYSLGLEEIHAIKKGGDLKLDNKQVIPNNELTYPEKHRRSYAFCSDTAYFPKITEQIKSVDLLYHESTFLNKDEKLAATSFHSTTRQAALIAKQAMAKKLLIGHYSTRYTDQSTFLEESREIFENTEMAEDNLKISL